MPGRFYTWRWQRQPPVVTKEPAANDVMVPAYYRPTINGPARGALNRRTQVPADGVWEAGVPHPNGPSFRARPLKIWRKRLAREAGRSGKSSGAGIGMPMDLPGGESSAGEHSACVNDTACSYTTLPCDGLDEDALNEISGVSLRRLRTERAHSLRAAQALCTADGACTALLWSPTTDEARLYTCSLCSDEGEGAAEDAITNAIAKGVCGPCIEGSSLAPGAVMGTVQVKETCSGGTERCGGAILKDDVKSRSQGVPVRHPLPSDSFYDPAAFKTVCVACTPDNNRIRSTVQPVLGPGPNRSVDTLITALRGPGGEDHVAESVVFRAETRVAYTGASTSPLEIDFFRIMTIKEAIRTLSRFADLAAFIFKGTVANPTTPVEVIFILEGKGTTEVYDPEFSAFVKEPTFYSYVQAATDYRSYFHSRCREIDQRRGRGNRVPGLPYFDSNGHPLPPSDSPQQGPPNYRPITCPYFPATPSACSAPYKTSNPRFGVQGAVQSSARLARLKYESATRGSNFTTAGALHAKNFGEFTDAQPSGYFLPQKFTVAKCNAGLYRRSGDRVACFTPEPSALDRIEH